jgi:hypothetical protein
VGTLLNQINWKSLAALVATVIGMINPGGTFDHGIQALVIAIGGGFLAIDHAVSAYIEGVHTKATTAAISAKGASDAAGVGHALSDVMAHLTATGPAPQR